MTNHQHARCFVPRCGVEFCLAHDEQAVMAAVRCHMATHTPSDLSYIGLFLPILLPLIIRAASP